jgi:hypothetical protein
VSQSHGSLGVLFPPHICALALTALISAANTINKLIICALFLIAYLYLALQK